MYTVKKTQKQNSLQNFKQDNAVIAFK